MKVLWVEDHLRTADLLMAAATSASRRRYGLDLVMARSLIEAERRLRLERFDLVITDLILPDSPEEEMTVTRIAAMGRFRMAIVSASHRRQDIVAGLLKAGVNCAPTAIAKEDLALGEFVARPDVFRDFLLSLTPAPAATRRRAPARLASLTPPRARRGLCIRTVTRAAD